jgi:hypothetical protein
MTTPPRDDRTLDDFLWLPLGHRLRWALAACAAISAAAHVPVVAQHLRAAPYMGVEFIVLIVGCLLIGAAALRYDTSAVYRLATITCGLAVVGYLLTRAVAFPALADDVGNWFEPLGVVSVVAETATVAVAVSVLADRHHKERS